MKSQLMTKFLLFFILLIQANLFFLFHSSTHFSSGRIQQEENLEYEIVWLAYEPIRARKFPVILFSNTPVNMTIGTSWGFNTTKLCNPTSLDNYNVIWIPILTENAGNGSVTIQIENESTNNYNVSWLDLPVFASLPYSIHYEYYWFSHWQGRTLLTLDTWWNQTLKKKYQILERKTSTSNSPLFPYASSFDIINQLDSYFLTDNRFDLDFISLPQWQSWSFDQLIGLCDGGGFQKTIKLTWGNISAYNTSFEYIIDNDGCNGRRTLFSHPEMLQFFSCIENVTDSIVKESNVLNSSGKMRSAIISVSGILAIFGLILFSYRKKRIS